MPDIGAGIIAAATICGYYSIQTYIIDCYTKYAASAVAAITTLRSLAGFGFPLFAPYLYNSLGYVSAVARIDTTECWLCRTNRFYQGWGNSVLAFVALAIGIPAPWFFWRYGEQLRMKSQFAAGG